MRRDQTKGAVSWHAFYYKDTYPSLQRVKALGPGQRVSPRAVQTIARGEGNALASAHQDSHFVLNHARSAFERDCM
jgi:hypothetical protein